MITIKHKIFRFKLFASRVSLLDLITPTSHAHFLGKVPIVCKSIKHTTSVIDLRNDMDVLMSKCKSTTRNEIRRAEKEGCTFSLLEDVSLFVSVYNDFAKRKGLPSINDYDVRMYKSTMITASQKDGRILSMHVNVVDVESKYAMLLYSCSPRLDEGADFKMIGWANRYLHFKEFEYFKTIGLESYDWNGVCLDPEQVEKYKIGQFKMAFGGDIQTNVWVFTPIHIIITKIISLIRR